MSRAPGSSDRLRAALYARVSTTGRGQEPDLQLEAQRRVAKQRRWEIVEEHVDLGVSGSKAKRPGLDALMLDARMGRIDVVAVFRFDRFARSVQHLVNALAEFESLNVQFVSLHEQVDTTTAMGRAMFHIIAAMAELQRELIRENVRAGLARARARGKTLGRPPRVAISREKVARLLAQGLSGRAVARELGAPPTSVRRVIKALRQNPSEAQAEKPPSPARERPGTEAGRNT